MYLLGRNRRPGYSAQRKSPKIVSAYLNFHTFRKRACPCCYFFPKIPSCARIYYTCTQILASSYLLVNLLELYPKHSILKHCIKSISRLPDGTKHKRLESAKKLGHKSMVFSAIQTHNPFRSPEASKKMNL